MSLKSAPVGYKRLFLWNFFMVAWLMSKSGRTEASYVRLPGSQLLSIQAEPMTAVS
jgi:hypothetical protein